MAYHSYDSAIEEIRSRCNIVDVISAVVPLKRAGSNYKGVCPFHNEKTPSFVVSEQKQIFTCFGCGATGNVIGFVQKYYNLTFPEAVERLAAQYGIRLENAYGEQTKKKDAYYEINRIAARYFFNSLTQSANKGYAYMNGRGMKPETIKTFGIGYADDGWTSLADHLKSAGVDTSLALELGLLSEKEKRVYDKFRSRVMFPIINTRGKVIGFGGRIVGDGEPKYLNSQESIAFQKKYNLFGLNITKGEIQKLGFAILVEGYMDVVGLYQGGVRNAVASLGTALTEQQAKLLKRYTDKVVLCYDADAAGINAALRGIDVLRATGLDVRVLHVDDGKDPDEYIRKHGNEEFMALIEKKAVPDIDYKIELLKKKYDIGDTVQGIKFLQQTAAILRSLTPVEADMYIQKISRENHISEGALRREVEQGTRPAVKPAPDRGANAESSGNGQEPGDGKPSAGSVLLERTAIRLSMLNSAYFAELKDKDAFVTDEGRAIQSAMLKEYRDGHDFDTVTLNELLDDRALAYMDDILEDVVIGENDKAVFEDCLRTIEAAELDRRQQQILDMLSMADEDTDADAQKQLMKELVEIQQKRKCRG